jgi:hypothetical protein
VNTSHRPEPEPDATIRGGGGALTMSVLVSGCGPVSRTSRLVCPPAGTGTCTDPLAADQRSVWPLPFSDTASRLWARICRPAGPAGGVTRIVTVLEAGEKTHATPSGTGAGPERPRQPPITATSDRNATRTTARRNLYCRADAGE